MSWHTGLRELAAQPRWRRWTLASLLARLPTTMSLLALILVGEQVSSLAVGAQLAGVATFTTGMASLWRGRQLDRGELRDGLVRSCLATCAVLAAQAVAVIAGAPLAVLFALAFAQGIAGAAISGGFRALLAGVVSARDLPRANAMEAVFVEVAFVGGPALAGVLAFAVGPVGVLIAEALAIGVAAAVTRGLPTFAPVAPRDAAAPWRAPAARAIYLLAAGIGLCLGLMESAIPARLPELGMDPKASGFLLMLVGLGSGVAGLLTSGSTDLSRARLRAALLLAALGVLLVPAVLAGNVVLLGLGLLAFGAPIAPLNALGSNVLSGAIPTGRQTEGFALYIAAILLGAGLGQSATGQLLGLVSPQALLAGAAVIPLLLAARLAWPARRPQPAPAEELASAR